MFPSPQYSDPVGRHDLIRALVAMALLVALFTVLAFVPRRDPTKVVAGIPCSILSERAIGSVLGATMQLLPTDGTVCHYVSTDSAAQRTLFVVALHGDTPVNRAMAERNRALYVTYRRRTYELVIVGDIRPDASAAREHRLAALL
jgi:hypothetical protein